MDNYKKTIRQEMDAISRELVAAGVKFERDRNWAQFCTLENGDYVSIAECKEALEDVQAAMADGDYESITEALDCTVSAAGPEIEVCDNNEWLRVFGGYEPGEDTGNNEIDEDAWAIDRRNMEEAFPEAEFVAPRGNRSLCHQWNGAHFTHRSGGHGTFAVLTEEGEKLWDSL